jgi:hypothetical protein
LHITEWCKVDALKLAANGVAQFDGELSVPTEGRIAQIELKVDVAAVWDHAPFDSRAMGDESDEPWLSVPQVYSSDPPDYWPRFGH